ncbi:hypothetical protein HPB52_021092 [Rhipicephalus sanguineus]|uniref:MULE transposase domain-containing protein n=1 Tax=Rhipicephalus sanguineus TaxID=34632 RepID=A0A9D4PPP4_RHISA|nr:hypothetical protein HPB52_021092 [Rhipicephalus sanguineus]
MGRMVFHKIWRCKESKREIPPGKPAAHCPAKIDLKIKKVNRNTKRNDAFLRGERPLPAVIKLLHHNNHSHSTAAAEALSRLTPTSQTKQTFLAYFDNGMSPAEAIRLHESLDVKLGRTDDGQFWVVLVVTPIMRRAQQLKAASEMVFIDSTSSCDASHSTLTVLLTATNAGAIPIAVLIHNSQSTQGYCTAFTLLKDSFPTCFGGLSCPQAFMTDNSAAEKAALKAVWPQGKQLLCFFHVAQAEWRWLTAARNNISGEQRRRFIKLALIEA